MQKIIFLAGFIGLILVLMLVSCEEKTGVVGPAENFEIAQISIPAVLSSTSDKPVLFSAKVTHPDGNAGIDKVELVISDSLGTFQLALTLYDDGDAENRGSGDLIAFDQIYSVTLIGTQAGLPDGMYFVHIHALSREGEEKESAVQNLDIFPNQAPEIVNYLFPDSIQAGMQPTEIMFTVNDNDGLDDILWVLIQGFESGSSFPVFQDTIYNPGNHSAVFQSTIDSSYAAGKKGELELKFLAEDRVGDFSNVITKNVFFENTTPLVWNDNVPDTLQLPSSGDIRVEITVHVKDRQSLADIDSVYFNSFLPSGNPSSGNPFLMFDNGLPYDPFNPVAVDDDVEGDGIYTLTIFLPAQTPSGEYRFEFFARDKANQLTAGPVARLQVI